MNDTVPNFSSPGNQAWNKIPTHRDRVPIWPRNDMFHCVPILSVKDVALRLAGTPILRHAVSTLHAPTPRHAVSTLNALYGIEVFYPVPILNNRRKRKNRTETPALRLAGTPTPRPALSTLHALHRVPIVHRPISE